MSNDRPVGRAKSSRAFVYLVSAIVFPPLLFAVYVLQVRIDDRFGPYRTAEEVLYIENGDMLKKVLLGYESLAADLYWLRTVQYFGWKRLFEPDKRFDLLEPLLEITTDLDPHFKIAYTYGATFLSEPFPKGAGVPLKGVELIDKGIENNPDYWRFYLDKGFLYYWFFEDYEKAAEVFLEGSKLPGAPYWMTAMAGRSLTKGGERETARELWRILYQTAENEQMRGNAIVHLQQLDALDHVETLTQVAELYQEKTGRFPEAWQELIAAGYLTAVPADPTGVPYELNPREKKVELSRRSSLAAALP